MTRGELTRRQAIGVAGAAGAVYLTGCGGDYDPPRSAPRGPDRSSLSCVVRPELTEGPFFVDETLKRSDIRSDPRDGSVREGVPLRLGFAVYRVGSGGEGCTPLRGATVDVWQCDAEGVYSGIEANGTAGRRFLRGRQVTGADGAVEFLTIYPGWYSGRAVHVHFKVRTFEGRSAAYDFTSQLFFDDELTDRVERRPPYDERGARKVRNDEDAIYSQGGAGSSLTLALVERGRGYAGTFALGLEGLPG